MRISDWSSDVCSSDLQIADIRRRAEAYGRDPQSIKCIVAGTFVVAETTAEAHALPSRLQASVSLDDAAASYAFFPGLDLSTMDPDKPLHAAAPQTPPVRTTVQR